MTSNEAALKESEERYRSLVEHGPVGVYVHDGAKLLYASAEMARILGADSPEELVGRPLEKLVHPDDLATVRARIAALADGPSFNRAYRGRVLRLDGQPVHVQVTAKRCVFHGAPAVHVVLTDITEQARAEDKLREREAVLQAVFDAVAGGVALLSVEAPGRYRIEDVNPFLLRASGTMREQVVGRLLESSTPNVARIIDLVSRVVAHGETVSTEIETDYMRTHRWAMCSVSPIKDAAGVVRRVVVVSIPIDDRKQMEEALKATGDHYRALLEGQPDAIYRVRRDGIVVDAHVPDAASWTPRDTEVTLSDVVPKRAAEQLLPLVARAIDEGTAQHLEARSGEAEERYLECRVVRSGADEATLVVRDTTDVRGMQARLVAAERLASLGTLSAGVAHEINNPLAFLAGNQSIAATLLTEALDTLRSGSSPSLAVPRLERALAALRDAEEGARRVQHTVRDLKTFSRPDEEHRGPVDMRRVVESTLHIANNALRHRARIVTALAEVPPVEGNEARLGQVVLNLLVNAADAISEDARAATIRVSLRAEGASVVLEVEDTGMGIAPEALPRVFEPFFTTKPVGEGTGLGLSICHGIVTGLGGEIRVASSVGVGTTISVILPATAAPAARVSSLAPAATPLRRARVLVIDDEPLVGKLVARLLEKAHDVTVTESGRQALGLIESGTEFDVVFCDLMMPEMTGMAVYEAVLARAPKLAARFVFMTGGAFTASARDFLEQVAQQHVEKPFRGAAIEDAIRRVLGTA
jgi:two-component system, cell cycle sensor histidine kinase and response regulator CckA